MLKIWMFGSAPTALQQQLKSSRAFVYGKPGEQPQHCTKHYKVHSINSSISFVPLSSYQWNQFMFKYFLSSPYGGWSNTTELMGTS